jgi:hypothetical protein
MSRSLAIGGTVSPVLTAALGGGAMPRTALPPAAAGVGMGPPAMARPMARPMQPGVSGADYAADLTGLGPAGMMPPTYAGAGSPTLTGLPNTAGLPAGAAPAGTAAPASSPLAQLLASWFPGGSA